MPISVPNNATLEFKLVGEFNGAQETNNVFHYKESGGTSGTLDQYANGLMNLIETFIYPITSVVQRYIRIDASILDADGELVNGESVFFPSANDNGVVTGESMPPFVTWTYKYVRPDATFRHGFKRFAGVAESQQNSGFPDSGALSVLNAAAVALGDLVPGMTVDVDGNPDAEVTDVGMVPVILQRIINGDPISPVNVGEVGSVVFSKIGTQNSRKYGVGS